MKKLNLKLLAGILLVTISLFSCATTKTEDKAKEAKATLTKTDSRFFWRIDGTDANGEASTVYIQGTFHLGDERIFPLSDEVMQAFQNADRWAGEMSKDSYLKLAELGPELNAPNPDGKIVTDYLNEDEVAYLTTVFGEALPMVSVLEPWQLSNGISVFMYLNTGLGQEYGLDNNFISTLAQSNKEWEGMDELQVQLDVLTFGDYDTQIQMLKDNIRLLTDENMAASLNEITVGIYNAYLEDDTEKMAELLNEENESNEEMAPFYEDYNYLVYEQRNRDWANDITAYLAQGGETFIFVGSGHLLGDVSVFKFLKDIGTIE